MVLAEEIKKKIEELKENHPSYTVTLKEEWVCDICGTRTEVTASFRVVKTSDFRGERLEIEVRASVACRLFFQASELRNLDRLLPD